MAVKEIGTADFKKEVLESTKPVFVDFWATWCGPCRMLAPIVAELSEEHPEVSFVKVNVDENYDLAMEYKVSAIPTLMVFKGGNVAAKSVGFGDKDSIAELLK